MVEALDIISPVVWTVDRIVFIVALLTEVLAFGHCLMQRPDAFAAIGTLPKWGWLALTGGGALVTLLLGPLGMLGLIGITAAAVYLLDIRPGIRDVINGGGSGSW